MNKTLKILVMILVPIIGATLFIVPVTRDWILQVLKLLSTVDTEPVKEYLRSFGVWAALISFILMVIQSIAAPLPAFIITFANAAVFGWVWGAALSWASAMAGAALCFGIAKLYGRTVVSKLTGAATLKEVDGFFEKFGGNAIIIARLLPFVPFDPISYAAGLTAMRFWPFFLATGLGQLPATIVYSYAGDMLSGGAKTFVYALFIIFAAFALTVLLRNVFKDRIKAKATAPSQDVSE